MKEAKAMAYVNMYGVLACLENLCEIDDEAKAIIKSIKKPVSLCFDVANGPCCTFHFSQDGCTISEGNYGCTCKMNFASPEKFNALIDSGKPGMPTKNVPQVLSFLLGPFTKLTDRLTKILMPSEDDLKNRSFFEESTVLTFAKRNIAHIPHSLLFCGDVILSLCYLCLARISFLLPKIETGVSTNRISAWFGR